MFLAPKGKLDLSHVLPGMDIFLNTGMSLFTEYFLHKRF